MLGPILPVDVPALFEWSDDPEQVRLNEPYRPPNWHRLEAFWLNAEADPRRIVLAIRSRHDPKIIGYIQIGDIEPIHRSAVIGVRIGRGVDRGQGRGTEAMRLAIDYCWNDLNLTRLTLAVFADNERAKAIYHRLGFQTEGVFQRALFIGGRWIDVVAMALMRPSRDTA